MELMVRLDASRLEARHIALIDQLETIEDVDVSLEWTPQGPDTEMLGLQKLMRLERGLNGLGWSPSPPADRARIDSLLTKATASPDMVLDFTERPTPGYTWVVQFDGAPGERAALRAICRSRMPMVSIVDSMGDITTSGRPGSEYPGLVVVAIADLVAGVSTLVTSVINGNIPCQPIPDEPSADEPATEAPITVARLAVRRVAQAIVRRGYRLLYRSPHWRVGWRFVDGADSFDSLGHPSSGWNDLPDDGYRFYADPFPFVHEGRTFLFVEDFDHRLARGVISVVEFDKAGPVGVPRTVLVHESHLSYPFVLEAAGEIWMIPESSEAGTVELYRASRFPDVWLREAVLIEGLEVSDATPFVYEGRWWMAATVRHGGSYSDTLHLWFADDLRGPWLPHQANPVLVDIASARPAGRVVARGGRVLRPVQDCRNGYGAALAIAEITKLDDVEFQQELIARLGPSTRWAGSRLHTINRAGNLEVIDGSRFSPRLRLPRGKTRR